MTQITSDEGQPVDASEVEDFDRFIGKRTETGMKWPDVNLAGVTYARPGSTIGLGGGRFAVLSLNTHIDIAMTEKLKGIQYVSIDAEYGGNHAEPPESPQFATAPDDGVVGLQPQGDISPNLPDASDASRKRRNS